MNKGSFWEDTFEKAVEAGQSMAKGGAKQIKQTFNPLQMIKGTNTASLENAMPDAMKEAAARETAQSKGAGKSTPLDFAKLHDSYAHQDKTKADALRNRLFQMVKGGEEKIWQEKKQKKQEEEQRAIYEKEEKKRKDAAIAQQQTAAIPQGKEHKSVLAPKKKKGVQPSPAEIKPSTGKQ